MHRFLVPILALVSLVVSRADAQGNEAVMVMEAHSGKVLVAHNSTVERPIASLTKIATGVLVVDWAEAAGVNLDKRIATVPAVVATTPGPNPMGLRPGERLTLRDALFSAILGSDNMAALTLADHVGREFLVRHGKGGDSGAEFVAQMNELAKALEMRKTKFRNPHGLELPESVNLSTAADIAKLSVYAMRRPGFTFVSRQKEREVRVEGDGGSRSFRVQNTNKLVSEVIHGLKTGTTRAAGPCLAVAVERPPLVREQPSGDKAVTPRELIVVLLNSPDRFDRAKALIPRGWGIYDEWLSAGARVEDPRREIIKVPDPRG